MPGFPRSVLAGCTTVVLCEAFAATILARFTAKTPTGTGTVATGRAFAAESSYRDKLWTIILVIRSDSDLLRKQYIMCRS